MKTYKLQNSAKCIIRSVAPGMLGDMEMKYGNQPYTVLNDVNVEISFDDSNSTATGGYDSAMKLASNMNHLSNVRISNIQLTDKILKLIYGKNDTCLKSTTEILVSNNSNERFLNKVAPGSTIYQVFLYKKLVGDEDDNYELENAFGEKVIENGSITVKDKKSDYLICYSYVSSGSCSVSLNKPNNSYVALDIEVTGNINDQTTNFNIHIDKCCIITTKNIWLSTQSAFGGGDGGMNTVELNCPVITDRTTNHYITF